MTVWAYLNDIASDLYMEKYTQQIQKSEKSSLIFREDDI